MENLSQKHELVSRTYSKKSLIMASIFGSMSKSYMTMSLPSQDEPLINRPVASFMTEMLKNPRHYKRTSPFMKMKVGTTQGISLSRSSGPHDTQYCMENTKQDFVDYASLRTDKMRIIMEYLVNISKRRAFWRLNEDMLKITILKTNTPYSSRKIRRTRACTHQRPQRNKAQYAVSREDHYAILEIWNEYNILEDITRGPYSKKSPIRHI
ncbi:hypothetical protein Tco_0504641 [Tanacetum coccineum]